ncbi:MAG: phage scaffolding protein [Chloroflexi bacterium]|nr:phage scaffolding protein [Chloroflexota bacterium]
MADETQGQVPTEDAGGQAIPPDPSAPQAEEKVDPVISRLKAEAAEYRKRLRELEAKVKADEEAKLSETERLQKRLAELEREQALWQRERQERTLKYETMLAASRLGIVDPEAAYRLLDMSNLEFDEDGSPKNLEQALKDLLKAKPYLAGQPVVTAGSPTNPATGQQRGGTFTMSQIADRRFYEQHREDILRAMAEGRIVPG